MKIAVLGYGKIGGTLGKKWAVDGHIVQFGVRDPAKPEVQQLIRELGKNASASSVADAIASADLIVFAIPSSAVEETVSANAQALAGKVVVDATNNFGAPVANALAAFQSKAPTAQYYRAFNSYGWEVFEDPVFGGVPGDMFFCGPDSPARTRVEELITAVGLRPVYIGGPDQTGVVDGVLKLWAALALGQKHGRRLAFKMLTR
jgi:8-hydroxy-5-deazaflavin:NADPH oxidoreductase